MRGMHIKLVNEFGQVSFDLGIVHVRHGDNVLPEALYTGMDVPAPAQRSTSLSPRTHPVPQRCYRDLPRRGLRSASSFLQGLREGAYTSGIASRSCGLTTHVFWLANGEGSASTLYDNASRPQYTTIVDTLGTLYRAIHDENLPCRAVLVFLLSSTSALPCAVRDVHTRAFVGF